MNAINILVHKKRQTENPQRLQHWREGNERRREGEKEYICI